MASKVVPFKFLKAKRVVKESTDLISLTQKALTAWRGLRKDAHAVSKGHALANFRTAFRLPNEVTGSKGKKLLDGIKKRRKEQAALAMKLKGTPELVKRNFEIDRKINARSKGVIFRRINGRLIPIRPKK